MFGPDDNVLGAPVAVRLPAPRGERRGWLSGHFAQTATGGSGQVSQGHCLILSSFDGGLVPITVPAALSALTVIGDCAHGVA